MNIDVRELLSPKFTEPEFFINFYKIGRPPSKKEKTQSVNIWKIQDEKLVKIDENLQGIFSDKESYIIQWIFDLKVDNTLIDELMVYYWKGQNAQKGYSPLPPEIEEHCPVERIVQWSEPAIFFHCFSKGMFTVADLEDSDKPRLFLIRGELDGEVHYYEVPCEKVSLRSRACFLLVVPEEKQFIYWHGKYTSHSYRNNIFQNCQPHKTLACWNNKWLNFSVIEMEEGRESNSFLYSLDGDFLGCAVNVINCNFTPRLFYLNFITGSFLATEIEYPLRGENIVAPFPFLQSHLYTALQPALFLLDNHSEIWLWEGPKDESQTETFEEELKTAELFGKKYFEEKEALIGQKIIFNHVCAHREPPEFKIIFPIWKNT